MRAAASGRISFSMLHCSRKMPRKNRRTRSAAGMRLSSSGDMSVSLVMLLIRASPLPFPLLRDCAIGAHRVGVTGVRARTQVPRSCHFGSAPPLSWTGGQPAYLCFRRGARRHASLGHSYYAFVTAFLRRCYGQIFGPRRHLPKFANGVCRYSEIFVCLNSHLIWQAAKSDLERGSAFGLVSHKGLPYCPNSLPL